MTESREPARTFPELAFILKSICAPVVGQVIPKSGTVIIITFMKCHRIRQVRKRNHGQNALVLVGFGLFYLLVAGFKFCQELAGQDTGTDVGYRAALTRPI